MRSNLVRILLVLLLTAGIVFARVMRPSPVRTIHLSMKAYTFNDVNPTITLRAGERVRFLITNDEETPILHNFQVPGLGISCGDALRPGEHREILVTAATPGTFAYACCTHRGMGGKLVVLLR